MKINETFFSKKSNLIILHKLNFNTLKVVPPPLQYYTFIPSPLPHLYYDLKSLEFEAFKMRVMLALISSKSLNRVPFSTDLSLVNRKKSQGARSGCRVGVAMWE